MNDKFRDDQPSKPNAGIAKLHSEKDNVSAPASAGAVVHPEKTDGKNRQEPLSKPGPSGAVDRGKDPKNVSKPTGGSRPIPRERLHLDQVKADAKKESR